MPDLFFFRDADEVEEEESKAAQEAEAPQYAQWDEPNAEAPSGAYDMPAASAVAEGRRELD